MSAERKKILVYAHWVGFNEPTLMGMLYASLNKGKELFSFEYNSEWLKLKEATAIDPDLQLFSGPQYLNEDKSNFGIFLDSSPDRWGRLLMRRKEAAIARKEERKPRTLFESDYVLGVFDANRMGALRFKTAADGPFLDNNAQMSAPPWTALRDLEYASLQLERDDAPDDPEYLQWLNMLMAPGSSLGGARPKANVQDTDGSLWIAKFPSGNDDKDIGAWEQLIYEMAIQCGIDMAASRIQKFSHHQHTFITKRFDRTADGQRIHFASAMTLLGYTDGVDHQDDVSYLDLVEFLMQNGANIDEDLVKLWTRVVFNICVSNTDDHLRNHGFILSEGGWTLSPAYDINPIEGGNGHKLNIDSEDNSQNLELALSVAPYFRLDPKEAQLIIDQILEVVSNWQILAKKMRISRAEIERMGGCFKL
ncbi:type II toxin-antitoxin system HipA family toxin [Lacinutrix jangbogonensis]|uniref:type II toxin-antitoxin system HipA family toxin n=1 Tax=Lacinutrix jangbogonensis TaxID=1469557 RepID=UPI00053D3F9B|nr:HipA domain-containing protein [Lacinutrix jangbogonensis]